LDELFIFNQLLANQFKSTLKLHESSIELPFVIQFFKGQTHKVQSMINISLETKTYKVFLFVFVPCLRGLNWLDLVSSGLKATLILLG
jgi:hypothetical protein